MSEPLRVAQVMGYMNGGGVEQVVMNYYRHIDRSRVQFDFLVCKGSTRVPRKEIESLGGFVYTVPPYSDYFDFQRALASLFRRQGWAIVHSHLNSLSVFSLRAAKRANVPIRIAHSHSTSGKGEYIKNAVKLGLRRFSNVYPTYRMACSNHAGEWLFGRKMDFEVVPNAIELDKFVYRPAVRSAVRVELGIPDRAFVVGHVGRFMEQKNHHFLIHVFTNLLREVPDAYLLLVGEGELMNEIRSEVKKAGIAERVLFLGQRSDVGKLYSTFDAFCLPSLYEGLGMVAIEAQCSGLPCIVSTEVPREVALTESVQFLPLNNVNEWVSALRGATAAERLEVDDKLFTAYEINRASQALCVRYESLVRDYEL